MNIVSLQQTYITMSMDCHVTAGAALAVEPLEECVATPFATAKDNLKAMAVNITAVKAKTASKRTLVTIQCWARQLLNATAMGFVTKENVAAKPDIRM